MHNVSTAVAATLVALAALSGVACQPPPAAAPPPPPAEVTVSRPLPRDVTDEVRITGTTTALEAVEVRARVSGFLERVVVAPRAKVKPGEVLFTIDARPFKNAVDQAEADLKLKEAQRTKAEFDADRISDLYERNQAAADEFSDAMANRDSMRAACVAATAALAQRKLELEWCEVKSPIAGRISRNLVDPGNIVHADSTVLATITNDEDVYVYFDLSEADVLRLQEETRKALAAEGKSLQDRPELRDRKIPVYIGLMIEQGYPHEGVLDYVAPALDPSTGTIQARARIPNAEGILASGLFVRVRIPTSKPYQALTVTERALGSDQGQRFLYIVNDQNVVEYRPVAVGMLDNGLRVISAGLKADDRVIVTGIQRVRPGLTVKPIDAPMPVGPVVTSPASRPASSKPAAPSGH